MPNYIRKNGDVKYRKVSVQSDTEPVFMEFTAPNESISYTEVQIVEVVREDGSTELYREGPLEIAQYTTGGANKFLINRAVPRNRLWMRRNDGMGVDYKVPVQLPEDGGNAFFLVSSGVQNMELFGDKYFEKIYQLQKI